MLALTRFSDSSILDDEVESRRLDVWLALMLPFTKEREASMLEDEFDSERLEV
jgi:hypothetical protein